MNISLYIKDLLYTHDCVILPSFGGFITNYKNAVIDSEQSLFLPPSKELGFNSDLKHNDGLIISKYSKKNNCSYIEAKVIISNFVKKIKTDLEASKTVIFSGVGSFKIDKSKKLLFTPDTNSNFLIDAFGLSSFQFPELESYDVKKHIESKYKNVRFASTVFSNPFVRKSVIAITSAAIITSIIVLNPIFRNSISKTVSSIIHPTESIAEIYSTEKSKIDNSKNNPEIESIEAAVGLITNKRTALNPYTNIKVKDKAAKNEISAINSKQIDKTEKPIINKKAEVSSKNTKKIERSVAETQATKQVSYYIIAGSFGNKINAKYLQNKFLKKGYKSVILNKEKGLFRVAIDVKTDKSVATKELLKLKSLYKTLSIWILTK